jgi:hypothetical protein
MATRRHTLYTTTTFYKKAGGTPTSATTCQPRPAPHLRGRGRRLHNLTAATISYSAAARANESSVLDRISITCALVIHRPRGIASKELTIRFWRSSAEKTKRGCWGRLQPAAFSIAGRRFTPFRTDFCGISCKKRLIVRVRGTLQVARRSLGAVVQSRYGAWPCTAPSHCLR